MDAVFLKSDISLLERNAIGPQTAKHYAQEIEEFTAFGQPRGLNWEHAEALDKLVVDHPNQLYLSGYRCYRGDRLGAAIRHHYPQYGKYGAKKLPRMWRAIRGFRKLTPGKTRKALPLSVWAALAVELKRQRRLRMALFLLLSVSSYARPSELLRMRLFSLVPPVANVCRNWSLLLSPEEGGIRTKVGEFDASIILNSPWSIPWAIRMFEMLKEGHPTEPLWDFTYDEYTKEFNRAAEKLGLEITPYQTRHSGPSIDRARKLRSQQEVQRRGQWKSQSSVQRYEKSARLASNFEALPQALQTHCNQCEAELSEIMLGTRSVPQFVATKGSRVPT